MNQTLHDLTFTELEAQIRNGGISPIHARRLWRTLHRELATDLAGQASFLPPLRRWVEKVSPTLEQPRVAGTVQSSDGLTQKFLLELSDGQTIETVIMGYANRFTACVSTQAGCAMGCVFCATGQMGFSRHLRAGEIVAQVLHDQRVLKAAGEKGLRNIVLMGMGEPLHNYDAVMAALDIISDRGGLNIGPARISISTVGVVPGILRLAKENRPYNLAVSLHGADDADRGALVPINKRWPLAELISACRTYGEKTGRRIFFEWTLIEGKNDTPEQARKLAALLQGIDSHINLIPLNPTGGYAGSPTLDASVERFQKILLEAGYPATVRQRRGIDVAAGCGQLKAARGTTL
jgi:23S rRNA (adenine2503-C2)-methyltransferase